MCHAALDHQANRRGNDGDDVPFAQRRRCVLLLATPSAHITVGLVIQASIGIGSRLSLTGTLLHNSQVRRAIRHIER